LCFPLPWLYLSSKILTSLFYFRFLIFYFIFSLNQALAFHPRDYDLEPELHRRSSPELSRRQEEEHFVRELTRRDYGVPQHLHRRFLQLALAAVRVGLETGIKALIKHVAKEKAEKKERKEEVAKAALNNGSSGSTPAQNGKQN
jgi:hypothetical protein